MTDQNDDNAAKDRAAQPITLAGDEDEFNTAPDIAFDIAEFLTCLMDIDSDAISSLVERRVACNNALAKHPTVQVGKVLGLTGGTLDFLAC